MTIRATAAAAAAPRNDWCSSCSAVVCQDDEQHGSSSRSNSRSSSSRTVSYCTICGSALTPQQHPPVGTAGVPQQQQQQPYASFSSTRRMAPLNPTLSEVLGRPIVPPRRPTAAIRRDDTHDDDDDDDDDDNNDIDDNFEELLERAIIFRLETTAARIRTALDRNRSELHQHQDAMMLQSIMLPVRSNQRYHNATTTSTTSTTTTSTSNTSTTTTETRMMPTARMLQLLMSHSRARSLATATAATGFGRRGNQAAAGVPSHVLDGLPRERLTDRSSLLKEATLSTWISPVLSSGNVDVDESNAKIHLPVVPVEFGAAYANLQNLPLLLLTDPDHTSSTNHHIVVAGTILVVRCRDNERQQHQQVTTATWTRTARWAQQRGALGLVLIHHKDCVVAPWSGSARMTSGDINTHDIYDNDDITIPVVMAPHGTLFSNDDGISSTLQQIKASLIIRENIDLTCCVCTESFCDTITISLPQCHHRFHEACAVTWLSRHNSCPYCRSSVVDVAAATRAAALDR